MIKTADFKICHSFIDSSVLLDETSVDISTDSRQLDKNQFFLAITGEKFNALNFLDKVKESGCKNII